MNLSPYFLSQMATRPKRLPAPTTTEIDDPPTRSSFAPIPASASQPLPPAITAIRGNTPIETNNNPVEGNLIKRPSRPPIVSTPAMDAIPATPAPTSDLNLLPRPQRPAIAPRLGNRALAEAELGAQQKRGFWDVIKDIGLGFAGGGLGGAIAGGIKGGDYRYQNRVDRKAADLAQADEATRIDKLDDFKQQQYEDSRADNEFTQELARQREKREQEEFGFRKDQAAAQIDNANNKAATDYDLITGYDEEGNPSYYRKTAKGLELIKGVTAPLPKGERIQISEKEIEDRAANNAMQRYIKSHPDGEINPDWLYQAKINGYDPNKPPDDAKNAEAAQTTSAIFKNIPRLLPRERSNLYNQYLNEEKVKERDRASQLRQKGQIVQQQNSSEVSQLQQTARPQRTPEQIETLRQKYMRSLSNPGVTAQEKKALIERFKSATGQDLDLAGIQSPTEPQTQPQQPVSPIGMGDVRSSQPERVSQKPTKLANKPAKKASSVVQKSPAPPNQSGVNTPAIAQKPVAPKPSQEQINREFYQLTQPNALKGKTYQEREKEIAAIKAQLQAKYGVEPEEIAPLTNTFYNIRDMLNLAGNVPQGAYAGR